MNDTEICSFLMRCLPLSKNSTHTFCMKKQRPFCYRMLFTVVLLLCFSFVSQAQIRTMKVCGLVTDKQSREVLIGASVTVAGTTEGSVTDVSGHYRLSVPLSNKVTLRFSYLGYHDREDNSAPLICRQYCLQCCLISRCPHLRRGADYGS